MSNCSPAPANGCKKEPLDISCSSRCIKTVAVGAKVVEQATGGFNAKCKPVVHVVLELDTYPSKLKKCFEILLPPCSSDLGTELLEKMSKDSQLKVLVARVTQKDESHDCSCPEIEKIQTCEVLVGHWRLPVSPGCCDSSEPQGSSEE
jgi:hypothetical protein